MKANIFDGFSISPAAKYIRERAEEQLACRANELADLRFSIIVTARWERSDDLEPERHSELRTELTHLRELFNEKVDEIAMTFGVPQAMKAIDDVERSVFVPEGIVLPARTEEWEELYF
jgi:hypothetical protein